MERSNLILKLIFAAYIAVICGIGAALVATVLWAIEHPEAWPRVVAIGGALFFAIGPLILFVVFNNNRAKGP